MKSITKFLDVAFLSTSIQIILKQISITNASLPHRKLLKSDGKYCEGTPLYVRTMAFMLSVGLFQLKLIWVEMEE